MLKQDCSIDPTSGAARLTRIDIAHLVDVTVSANCEMEYTGGDSEGEGNDHDWTQSKTDDG
jgi:hypothetical protein